MDVMLLRDFLLHDEMDAILLQMVMNDETVLVVLSFLLDVDCLLTKLLVRSVLHTTMTLFWSGGIFFWIFDCCFSQL